LFVFPFFPVLLKEMGFFGLHGIPGHRAQSKLPCLQRWKWEGKWLSCRNGRNHATMESSKSKCARVKGKEQSSNINRDKT
jgi:hypothetical protein